MSQARFDLALLTNFNAEIDQPLPPSNALSVRFTGTLTAPASGEYRLSLAGFGDGRVFLDDQLVVDMTGAAGVRTVTSAPLQLDAGESRALRVEFAMTHPNDALDPGR